MFLVKCRCSSNAEVAQLVEQRFRKAWVGSPTLPFGSRPSLKLRRGEARGVRIHRSYG